MTVEIAGLKMKNPVMTASGTFGYGEEYADYVDLNQLGGIVVKGLSLEAASGKSAAAHHGNGGRHAQCRGPAECRRRCVYRRETSLFTEV